MNYKQILDDIIHQYESKYLFAPTVDVQSFALSRQGVIILDFNLLKNPNAFFIFSVLHEIGHCETYKPKQTKATREFLATQWAIKEFNALGLKLTQSDQTAWQEYIYSFDLKHKNKHELDWNLK